MSDLTILTVTDRPRHADTFLPLLAENAEQIGARFLQWDGKGAGLLEYALDAAVSECADGYVMVVADDESLPKETVEWLASGAWEAEDNWCFRRRHLWPDASTFITSRPLYPDLQTRLAVKAKSGGRTHVHAGSPFGRGTVAPVPIDHHKFLVRTLAERQRILDHYISLDPMAGRPHYRAFSIPEEVPDLQIQLVQDEQVAVVETAA